MKAQPADILSLVLTIVGILEGLATAKIAETMHNVYKTSLNDYISRPVNFLLSALIITRFCQGYFAASIDPTGVSFKFELLTAFIFGFVQYLAIANLEIAYSAKFYFFTAMCGIIAAVMHISELINLLYFVSSQQKLAPTYNAELYFQQVSVPLTSLPPLLLLAAIQIKRPWFYVASSAIACISLLINIYLSNDLSKHGAPGPNSESQRHTDSHAAYPRFA